jgi:hypothetical protein
MCGKLPQASGGETMKPQGNLPQRYRHSLVSSPHSLQSFVKMITRHALVINISDQFGVAIGENVVDWLPGDGRFLQFVVTDLGTSTPIWRSLKEGIEL